jgi:gamma-glutamylcyclotransferase (GGCT)/AIG2-like uncharacterized protein YtfP
MRLGAGGVFGTIQPMQPEQDLALFVYGSLKPGESNWKRYCEGRVAELHPARVRGRLYQLSDGYLALTQPETHSWVRGWRLVLRSAEALREIDRQITMTT